jgi:hypothetical protein
MNVTYFYFRFARHNVLQTLLIRTIKCNTELEFTTKLQSTIHAQHLYSNIIHSKIENKYLNSSLFLPRAGHKQRVKTPVGAYNAGRQL